MPTKTEQRLELLENLLIGATAGTGGAILGAELQRYLPGIAPRARPVLGLAGTVLKEGTVGFARKHPAITVAAIAFAVYKSGLSVETAADLIQEEIDSNPQFFIQEQVKQQIRESVPDILSAVGGTVPARPTKLQKALIKRLGIKDRDTKLGGIFMAGKTRKVSKANRAVKQAMTWLKGGTKSATGTKPGILPRGAFRTAVKAAGRANPNTKSRIGKGKSIMDKLARRLKKWW